MIVVRDEFQLKFGVAREATSLFQEGMQFLRKSGSSPDIRLLTDLTGSYYRLVLESTYTDLATYEGEMRTMMANAEWKAWYARFIPLAQGGRREIFSVVGTAVPPLPSAATRATSANPA